MTSRARTHLVCVCLLLLACGCQILIELRTLHKSDVPGIICFLDAFYADNAVHIVLEYMDRGSLGQRQTHPPARGKPTHRTDAEPSARVLSTLVTAW